MLRKGFPPKNKYLGYSGPSSYDVPPLAYEQQSSGYDVPAGYEAPRYIIIPTPAYEQQSSGYDVPAGNEAPRYNIVPY